jgi:hypothetical protein
MKINILLFWFVGYDLGEGRTYQKVAEHLAKMPEVARVVVIFPPKKNTGGNVCKTANH